MAIVTLLSDFGTRDGYAGAMKGVVLTRAPAALVVDLTHDIPPRDVRTGARALREATATFPAGSIHVGVVDPGVGTARRGLLLRDRGRCFVGPDNGLLSLAVGEGAEGWVLDRPELFAAEVSPTFHGRDVFASVAGHLAAGLEPARCGTPIRSWEHLALPAPLLLGDALVGRVIHIDGFGNLITNLRREVALAAAARWGMAGAPLRVRLADRDLGPPRATFGEVEPGAWVAYWGSGGELEIAVRDGDAAASLEAPLAMEVELCC